MGSAGRESASPESSILMDKGVTKAISNNTLSSEKM